MRILVLVLRLLHIVGGTFWVGGTLITSAFVMPAAAATGEAGQLFLAHVIRTSRMSQRFAAAAGLTLVSGAGLYWIDSGGLTSAWMRSGPGWGFGAGAVIGLAGFLLGTQVGAATGRIGRIAGAVKGKPTQGQMLQLEAAQKQLGRMRLVQDGLLMAALICMATARYWVL